MNKHQLILLNYKNQKDIFEYCNKNNLNNLIDNNKLNFEL